ncbi:MAG: thermostable hemolysin [Mariprofundaceae bacterium]
MNHPERGETEQFIHDRFNFEYDADIRHYMPHLVRISTREGEIVAAVGYRDAACHNLFIEHYLDNPIEVVINQHLHTPIARQEIVEVGNLADAHPGGARAAITALTAYLYGAGFRWVVFTGVTKLRNAFSRLGIDTIHIGDADPSRLDTEEQESWGRYYLAGPHIMAGDIHEGYNTLESSPAVLQPLWVGSLVEGMQQGKKRKGL